MIENAGGNERGLPPDHPRERLQQHEQPERHDHRVQRRGAPIGRITHALDHRAEHQPGDQRDQEAEPVRPRRVDHADQAMNVVTIAIAPWAKLTIRVARQISTSASANAA